MSAPFYSYDPCVCTGLPCGACYPYSTKPCAASRNDLSICSVCPGGGCSPCPAPVRPCPEPCPPMPILPCLPPCPPCDKVKSEFQAFPYITLLFHTFRYYGQFKCISLVRSHSVRNINFWHLVNIHLYTNISDTQTLKLNLSQGHFFYRLPHRCRNLYHYANQQRFPAAGQIAANPVLATAVRNQECVCRNAAVTQEFLSALTTADPVCRCGEGLK